MGIIKRFRARLDGVGAGPDFYLSLAACAFICASLVSVSANQGFKDLKYFDGFSAGLFWGAFFAAGIFLFAAALLMRSRTPVFRALGALTVAFAAVLAVIGGANVYFNMGLFLVIVVVARFLTAEDRLALSGLSLTRRAAFWIIVAVFVLFTGIVTYFTSLKYATYSNATFDFGIFAQMFEQMKNTGLPVTTVERSRLFSHFGVHFSPIFYLLLPGYLLFSSPYYLFFVQALFVGLGVFAVRGIALRLGASPRMALVFTLIYAFFPTMANGCFYDFHENKFLAVCILYLVYFLLGEKKLPIFCFALLTLAVKEDAMIYVAALALWVFFVQKKRRLGLSLFALSAAYFFFAVNMVALHGGEIMIGRLSRYYTSADHGFSGVVKTVFYNIGYLFSEVFKEPKLQFVLWLCAPLLFAPFFNKKQSSLFLLLPMLVINLMPDWSYQYNVDFQYTYGTAALLIFAAMTAVLSMTPEKRRFFALTSLALCIVFAAPLFLNKAANYSARYRANRKEYAAVSAVLKTVPRDKSVTAGHLLVPHLYEVGELYSIPDYYKPLEKTDYYLIDTRGMSEKDAAAFAAFADEYELVDSAGFVEVYRRK